ncbi:hypothetical protein JTB14_006136 [Gonioctena quinquepunctata]|nr:hypothetical protein JTB14_006136 [Gonioctena quinquepunctata]
MTVMSTIGYLGVSNHEIQQNMLDLDAIDEDEKGKNPFCTHIAPNYYVLPEEDKQKKAGKQAKKKELQERKESAEEQKKKTKIRKANENDSDSTTSESLSIETADSSP